PPGRTAARKKPAHHLDTRGDGVLQRAADGAVSLAARGVARVGGLGREPGVPAAPGCGHGGRSARGVRGLPAACRRGLGARGRAATAAGAVPLAFEEAGYDAYLAERVPGGGHWRDEVWIARAAAEADHVVYLPRVSHHTLAFATLGLKLGVGWLREDSRLELHRDADSFAEKFAEVNRLPAIADRLRLVVTDATAVQTTFGPDFGYVARPAAGLVLASTDLVAHEFVAHRWLAWTRAEATHGASAHWLLDGVYRQASLANRCLVQMVWGPGEAARTKSLAAPRV